MIEALFVALGLVFVLACGAFVAAEFAFITVNRASVESAAEAGDAGAAGVLEALRTLSTQLSGAQVGITITNLAIGYLAEPALAVFIRPPLIDAGMSPGVAATTSITLSLAIATAVTMLFGELVPKNLAIAKPMATARAVQLFHRGFTRAMGLPIRFTNGVANRILLLLGVEPQEELASARSAEELSALVRHSALQGTLAKETAELVERSLAFGERYARDAMTPRPQMVTIGIDATVSDLIALSKQSGHSRFPVMGAPVEVQAEAPVAGITHVRAALRVPYAERATTPVTSILTEATFIPDSLALDDLLDDLRAGNVHMAMVVDEFGVLVGVVTLEDLVEEIVGDVRDEHDMEDDPIHAPDGGWDLSGLLRIDLVNEITDLELPEGDAYDTIGGLVNYELGRLGEVGDVVQVEEAVRPGRAVRTVEIAVTAVDGHRIDSVHLCVPTPDPADAQAEGP